VPANAERRFVMAMARLRMSADVKDTGKPISKATL
jgi:hypothetical protein